MGAPFLFGLLHFFLCVCYTGIYDRLFWLFHMEVCMGLKLYIVVHTNTRLGYVVPTDTEILQMCERVFEWGFAGVEFQTVDTEWADSVILPLIRYYGVYANKASYDVFTYRCLDLPKALSDAWVANQDQFQHAENVMVLYWDTYMQFCQLYAAKNDFHWSSAFVPTFAKFKGMCASLKRAESKMGRIVSVPQPEVVSGKCGVSDSVRVNVLSNFGLDPSVINENYLSEHADIRGHLYMACVTAIALDGRNTAVSEDISDGDLVGLMRDLFGGSGGAKVDTCELHTGPVLGEFNEYWCVVRESIKNAPKTGANYMGCSFGGYAFGRKVYYSIGDLGFHIAYFPTLHNNEYMVAQKNIVADPDLSAWAKKNGIGPTSFTLSLEVAGKVPYKDEYYIGSHMKYFGCGRFPMTSNLAAEDDLRASVVAADDFIVFGKVPSGQYTYIVGQKARVHYFLRDAVSGEKLNICRINDLVFKLAAEATRGNGLSDFDQQRWWWSVADEVDAEVLVSSDPNAWIRQIPKDSGGLVYRRVDSRRKGGVPLSELDIGVLCIDYSGYPVNPFKVNSVIRDIGVMCDSADMSVFNDSGRDIGCFVTGKECGVVQNHPVCRTLFKGFDRSGKPLNMSCSWWKDENTGSCECQAIFGEV